MTTENLNPNHELVIKCKEITNHFENQIADLIIQARHLAAQDKSKIEAELKGAIQNINFILNSLYAL
ncbi:MAG: hypothetical protein V4612_04080 [Pseudomonadota bacterium]